MGDHRPIGSRIASPGVEEGAIPTNAVAVGLFAEVARQTDRSSMTCAFIGALPFRDRVGALAV